MLLRRVYNADSVRVRNNNLHNNAITFQMATNINLIW